MNFLKNCTLKNTEIFFIKFYIIGIAGIMLPFTREFFILLTPLSIILSFCALLFFHTIKPDTKTILVFLIIGITGYLIEVTGVETGCIFGEYYYGKTLGFKISGTPLIIGLNWVMLVYISASLVSPFSLPRGIKIILAALLMLLYDIILEQAAPDLNMWHWKGDFIPLRNYAAWFIISFIYQLFFMSMNMKSSKLARVIYICQVSFFMALIIFFRLNQ